MEMTSLLPTHDVIQEKISMETASLFSTHNVIQEKIPLEITSLFSIHDVRTVILFLGLENAVYKGRVGFLPP